MFFPKHTEHNAFLLPSPTCQSVKASLDYFILKQQQKQSRMGGWMDGCRLVIGSAPVQEPSFHPHIHSSSQQVISAGISIYSLDAKCHTESHEPPAGVKHTTSQASAEVEETQ